MDDIESAAEAVSDDEEVSIPLKRVKNSEK